MTPPADAEALLDALDPEQRQVAVASPGPMCVVAGAGTGKTRAITHRIAYAVRTGAYAPQATLALTFTARAAGEMRTRLRDLGATGVQARTFHAAALRQLHFFWPTAVGGAAPEVMAAKAPAVAEAAGRLRMRFDRSELRDLAAEIEWAKVSMLTPDSYAAAATRLGRTPPGLDPIAMARVLGTYEDVKSDRGVIDFEDVLLLTLGILRERPDVASAVRRQYRHFVVDEYQDVNALQQSLLLAWLGDREDLCVVGDPAQTIYSFTGASSEHLLGFLRVYPGATRVELVRNYRSTPQIIGLANGLARMPGGPRRWGGVELQARTPAGQPPRLLAYADDPAEAAGVAGLVADALANGTRASQVAILFRTNAQSEAIETALAERGIPYLVRGGERFFARREVREAMVLLRGGVRSDDASVPMPEQVRAILGGLGWAATPPTAAGAVRERWESLDALVGLADQLSVADPAARIGDVVRDLDERSAAQHAPSVEGVTLASLHAAKGLEWDVVIIAGCSDGLIPITMAQSPAELDEERRLLYVGITRARTGLVLTWAKARTPAARATRRPSRFLDGALGQAAGTSPTRTKRPRTRHPASCRVCGGPLTTAVERTTGRCAGCPPTYDEATFDALRTWRAAAATSASVPAYVVFTDATLTAIAERRPSTEAELLQISGVGQRKLTMYGKALLAVLDDRDPVRPDDG